MTKEEIEKELNKLDIPKDKYIVLKDASMVIQNVKKEASSIDLAIDQDIESKLQSLSYEIINNNKVYKNKFFNISTFNYNEIECIIINEIRYETLESIIKSKKVSNSKTDQKDIEKIDLFLSLKDNYRYEKELIAQGIKYICGVDEVGRGPLVGPVVAAAVILPLNFDIEGLTDSKKLSEKKRIAFDKIIRENALAYEIVEVDNETIDRINIYEATKLAMTKAIKKLKIKPEHILIDAMKLDLDIATTSIIKGDLKSRTISAASVLAKVYRDNILYDLDKIYPYYNYKKNKGYPTKEHLQAIDKYGINKYYRKSYGPIRDYLHNKK